MRPRSLKFVAPVLLLVAAIGLPTVADAQRVLDRIKKAAEDAARAVEAKKKAAEDAAAKEREKEKALPQSAPAPRGTGAAPNTAAPSFDGPAQRGNYGKIADYKAMPDIIGIHLGMPWPEALAVLRREYSKLPIYPMPFVVSNLPEPPQSAYKADPATVTVQGAQINTGGTGCVGGPGVPDQVYLQVTAPPNKPQTVYHMTRCNFPAQPLNRDVVLKSLRQKYGKEAVSFRAGGASVATRDEEMDEIFWFYDEGGKPAPLPQGADWFTLECLAGGTYRSNQVEMYESYIGESKQLVARPLNPWCVSSGVAVRVTLIASEGEFVRYLRSEMMDIPLWLRGLKVTRDWWAAEVERLRKEEIERSKQQKPRL